MTEAASGRRTLRLVAALLLAFALDAAYGGRLTIAAARPSLSLTALIVTCLFSNSETGAWMGFMVGLLEASFGSRFVGSTIVTRTLAGFLVGLLEEHIFRDNVFVAAAAVFVGTLFVNTVFFLFAPQHHALRWFSVTLAEAVYNMLLAAPLYGLLRRFIPRASH